MGQKPRLPRLDGEEEAAGLYIITTTMDITNTITITIVISHRRSRTRTRTRSRVFGSGPFG